MSGKDAVVFRIPSILRAGAVVLIAAAIGDVSGKAASRPNSVFRQDFILAWGDAAIAGLPMACKGANKTPPDCAAEAFPGPGAALPFAPFLGR